MSVLWLLALGLVQPAIISAQPTSSNSTQSESCSTNFFEMEKSLLLSTENRFRLLKSYFPPRAAHPVVIKVNYTFDDLMEGSQIWFWSESEFYFIQPLEIFQFTSLLFSNMVYRRGHLSVQLHSDCSSAPQEFFSVLTTRLKLYAQSSTTGPSSATQKMTDSYVAVAASWQEIVEDSLQSDFVKAWLHITLILFPLGTCLMLYLCDPVQLLLGDKTWTKLEDEHTHGTVASLIQISVLLTTCIFILDILGIYFTVTSEFISYKSNSAFYLSTVTGVIIDVVAFVWVMFVLVTCCYSDLKNSVPQRSNCDENQCRTSERIKRLMSTVMITSILSVSNHVHYVILAFISDPFHAGSIAIMYFVSFILFFFINKQFYNRLVLHSNKRPKIVHSPALCPKCLAKQKSFHSPLQKVPSDSVPLTPVGNGDEITSAIEEAMWGDNRETKCKCFIPGPSCHTPFNIKALMLSLMVISPVIILYESILVILFFTLPLTKSIEDAPSKLYSIYQGTGLLIVGLLTYNIVLHPNPFSITKTVERLAKRLRLPEKTNYWNRLTDEEKCAKVISTLMEGQFNKAAGVGPYMEAQGSNELDFDESKMKDSSEALQLAEINVESRI